MVFVSSSRRNPNPKFLQPSPSTSSIKRKREKRRRRRNKNMYKNNKIPNWSELPEDIWFLILSKLNTFHIIENVQKVCMLFRKICKQPSMFTTINMSLPDVCVKLPYDVMNAITRFAVDRSSGCLLDIYIEYSCDDHTLMYIVERSKNLKHLRLGHELAISDEVLIKAVECLPVLEELELIICFFEVETIEIIGRICPTLKSFSLNDVGSREYEFNCNEEALAISESMPKLRHLQLIGNLMTNLGLKAILDGCPLLESLDLRACFHLNLSEDLVKRCEHIKILRKPYDSTADYGHEACSESEDQFDTYLSSLEPVSSDDGLPEYYYESLDE